MRSLWTAIAIVLAVVSVASARVFWIPVAGPMYKKTAKRYVTIKSNFVAPLDGTASGTVKLDCNAGDDADRLIVRASGLPKNAQCKLWFTDAKGNRMGEPFAQAADDEGNLKLTVYGSLCYLKEFPNLIVVVDNKVALAADLRPPASPSPVAR